MRCYICDREDDLINYDRKAGCYNPCHVCQAVIEDCVAGYDVNDETDIEVPPLE